MSEIEKLLAKKDGLLIEIVCIEDDLKEYINHPVETVSVDQLHYQYDFLVRQIQQIDCSISLEFNKLRYSLDSRNLDLKKLTDKATSQILFTVKDLPKNHYSLWQKQNSPYDGIIL